MDSTTPATVGSLLLADAEIATRTLVQTHLVRCGWEVLTAETGRAAMEILSGRSLDAVVVDLNLPDLHGIDLLQQVRMMRPGLPVLTVATAPSVEQAVEAMRAGAVDFLSKPISCPVLQAKLREWTAVRDPRAGPAAALEGCVSVEPAMATIFREASRLAAAALPVAICGAPGTGRRFLAAAMHQNSMRSGMLQTIDISVLSTEQVRARMGQAVETAGRDGAVLVADLQQLKPAEQDFLGRLLAADPETMPRFYVTLADTPPRLQAAGRLARSVTASLETVLSLPPLVARRRDIRLLSERILARIAPAATPSLAPPALLALAQYDWPGNLRQLRLVLERAARMAGAGPIELRHLPILQAVRREPSPVGWSIAGPVHLQEIVEKVERQLIDTALHQACQSQVKAAVLLGIPRTTLRDKLEKYGFIGRESGGAPQNCERNTDT